MVKVDVVLRDVRTPGNQIRMSIEEYTVFIERQSVLLGIKEPEKSTKALFANVEYVKEVTGHPDYEKALEGIRKATRRINQC